MIALTVIDTPLLLLISLLIGSVTAFLFFNIYPASIFLGDAGALSFGAIIAVLGLLMGNIIALLFIGGLFFVEALSSVIQILWWKLFKKKFFPIAPIHHTFLVKGWQEPKIVMRAWIIGIILAFFGLWLATI
jgi:phospho-N-acetylmuramoyl-pentapeptide-transferase